MAQKKKKQSILRRLFSDKRGNVAITFSLAIIPIFFSVGAAVDYSRYSRGFDRLVSAGDTAVIAASIKLNGSGVNDDEELKEQLEEEFDKFVAANFDANKHQIEFTRDLTFSRENRTLTVEIEGTQETTFLKAVGFNSISYTNTLGTRLETTPENYVMDIVMCIDATGSMQNTLNSVQANAATFNTQLRAELNIDQDDPRFKVRVRPIYFRDWADQQTYGQWGWRWTYYPAPHGYWHRWHQIWSQNTAAGINMAPDFYDLDKSADTTNFQAFLNSESASGGGDAPEAAGACLNEGMRSDWYDREETDDFPDDENVTVFPIIVTWTDNSIQSLPLTQQWISPSQPTSYNSFKTQWENAAIIPQDPKLLILFGPETWSGWSTIRTWDNYAYGGSINTGNSQAISVIADKIIQALPDVLRLTN